MNKICITLFLKNYFFLSFFFFVLLWLTIFSTYLFYILFLEKKIKKNISVELFVGSIILS